MSTPNKKNFRLKMTLIQQIMDAENIPLVDSVNYLFRLKGTSISKLSKEIHLSRQAMYSDINGEKPCPKFREKVEELLGQVPWLE